MIKQPSRNFRYYHHKIKDRIRDFKVVAFKFIFDSSSIFLKTLSSEDPILVLRLDDKIGDSIAATGFLRELKKNNEKSKLIVLAGGGSVLIYKKLAFIDEVIPVKKGFFRTIYLYLKFRKIQFKYIINTSHMLTPRVLFLCSRLRAYKKATFLNLEFKMFNQHVIYNASVDHVTIRYENTLKALNNELGSVNLDYEIKLDPEQEQLARYEVQKLRERFKKVIILNSFAGARFRNFNQQTTENIVKDLIADKDVVVVSIGNHNDLPLAESWISALSSSQWLCYPGSYDLSFNFGLVKYSDVVITPDTALVHVASALKKDLVCVFREDGVSTIEKNCQIWAPYKTRAKVLYAPTSIDNPEDINTVNSHQIATLALGFLN